MTPRIGSLFSGYGGLDLAVEAVTGAQTAWVSDVCKVTKAKDGTVTVGHHSPHRSPCSILAHRFPHAPNLGDISKVKWTPDCPTCGKPTALYWKPDLSRGYYCPTDGWWDLSIRFDDPEAHLIPEPVEVITGGFPCQDVSHAGKRAGLHDHTRTGLWSYMRDAIDQLRPALVVAENVRGLLSAEAASDMEPCPWCLGDGEGEPALRALGAVLADLADIGYDAQWCGLRAADVGAPHGRFRVFVVAYPNGQGPQGAQPAARRLLPDRGATADADGLGRQRPRRARGRRPGLADSGLTATDASGDGRDEGRTEPARLVRGPDAPLSSDAPTPDTSRQRHGRGKDSRSLGRVDSEDEDSARERERPRPVVGDRSGTTPSDTQGVEQRERIVGVGQRTEPGRGTSGAAAWGIYGPAIARWESVLGRPAPAPLRPDGKHGAHRLNPAAVEFLMGLPAGWVMDVPDLTRSEQLKAFGNGVVPQQAAAALRHLLRAIQVAA